MADGPKIDPALARRLALTVAVWIAGAALSLALHDAGVVAAPWSFQALLTVVVIDAWSLHGFLEARAQRRARAARVPVAARSGRSR
jgi:hypothetical protein